MKKYALFFSTAVVCLLFLKLLSNYSNRFDEIDNKSVSANLIPETDSIKVKEALLTLNIDEADASFLSRQITEKLRNRTKLTCLSDLNKRVWQIPSSVVDSTGSLGLRKSLASSRKSLGQGNKDPKDEEGYRDYQEYKAKDEKDLKSRVSPNDSSLQGPGVIEVKVYEKKESFIKRLLRKDEEPRAGVLVRLSEHYMDSLNTARRTLLWAKTDSKGNAVFENLDTSRSYSVLPIKEGFEYGSSQGTTKGSLSASTKNGTAKYKFAQQELRIRMFDARTLSQIKEKHILTVRSPQEYRSVLLLYLILFLGAWWGLYLLRYRRFKISDSSILSLMMLLTGLSILSMFSINDPLEDTLLGVDMAQGVIAGVIVMGLLQFVDFTKLYQNRAKIGFDIPFECISWIFKPYRQKVSYLTKTLSNKKVGTIRKMAALLGIVLCLPFLILDLIGLTKLNTYIDRIIARLPKGSGYIFTALLLTALLWSPLGSEVGGMKVNLNFGIKFQPSEIAKYLIVFFMAAFFSVNANKIMKYSAKGNVELFGHKLKMLSAIIIGLGILMVMYLVLGDMGPALVLAFTFIILYSIVKSKVNLESLDERSQNIKILTCDLAMLAYGVISFIVFLYIGNMFGREHSMPVFCVLWFVLWIILGLSRKQLFESAILFNLIISAFIFGGSLLSKVPISSLNKIGERLESRNEMCTNTWGTLPIDGAVADAGENTQVAEGLWGLASGGLWGQGLGNGSPNFIPAFHTDMILESIGEQLGFVSVFVVILILALLLRKTILLGYKTSHPFAFYLCLGISIVTAVQFVIISLGSTGIIPLTGVTVPFLSYGKVSMILNMAAFGIILSYDTAKAQDKFVVNSTTRKNISQYNYSVSVLSWLYCGIALFICLVFFHYQFTDRNTTLVKPVYVHNADGVPVVEYNPRIAQLTNKMWAGDIYDRNGVLLATSDKSKLSRFKKDYENAKLRTADPDSLLPQKRYYPYGSHLAFMLGKYGSDIAAFRSENSGYAAEYRHMSELRGFDNKKYEVKDGKKIPLKVTLVSKEFKPGRFIEPSPYTVDSLQIRDYSALIPYLKAGYNSDRIANFNARDESFLSIGRLKPQDIQLTIDAKLQTLLQERIVTHIENKSNLVRVSVVVLDAKDGDLLASAMYPLPNEDRLREEQMNGTKYYVDKNRDRDRTWKSYSDMDLGLMFATPPGSTAKVMSAMAGLRRLGAEQANTQKYKYLASEKTGLDPKSLENKLVTMNEAITWSSNNYFIKLVNDKNLYNELAYIYSRVGARVDGESLYRLHYSLELDTTSFYKKIQSLSKDAVHKYSEYQDRRKKEGPDWIHALKDDESWMWAYGQGKLDATPIAMARVASTVVNNGKMPISRYTMDSSKDFIEIMTEAEANTLYKYMNSESINHSKLSSNENIGGKTGTPERVSKTQIIQYRNKEGEIKTYEKEKDRKNDAWYICFIKNAFVGSKKINEKDIHIEQKPIAIAVRLERVSGISMTESVPLMKDVVLEVLKDLQYMK